jgi:hypothetical protein
MSRLADHIPDCPEVFADLEVVYESSWQDYEESGWVVVFRFFDELHVVYGGYSVMSEDHTFQFDPYVITEDGLATIRAEWAKHEV